MCRSRFISFAYLLVSELPIKKIDAMYPSIIQSVFFFFIVVLIHHIFLSIIISCHENSHVMILLLFAAQKPHVHSLEVNIPFLTASWFFLVNLTVLYFKMVKL